MLVSKTRSPCERRCASKQSDPFAFAIGCIQFTVLMLLALLCSSQTALAQEGGWRNALTNRTTPDTEAPDPGGVTPSHVFQAAADLVAEIEILREEMGVHDYPPVAEIQENRAPIHIYAKTLEVMSKVVRIQRRLGMPIAEVGQIPLQVVETSDVLGSVSGILDELRRIKVQMVIERSIDPAPFAGGKTLSSAYKIVADASYLLDGLAGGRLTPTDAYLNTLYILDDLELVAAKLGAPVEFESPAVEGSKTATEVAQQTLRAGYKVVSLQTRLRMNASSVPNLTLVRVTPSEVFDATNMLLAEMTRIKHHLNIDIPREQRPSTGNKTLADVFGQVMLILQNLDSITAAAAG